MPRACPALAVAGAIALVASAARAQPSPTPRAQPHEDELPLSDDAASLLLEGGAARRPASVELSSAEPILDWPEPDRTPPTIVESRLSVGALGAVGSPLGPAAIQAEYYPWNPSFLTLGFRAAYGPWGALGPTVSEGIALDLSLGRSVQWGMGFGVAESFRAGPTAEASPGLPSSADFFDADSSHVSIFLSRALMLRAGFGIAVPIAGCKEPFGPGSGTCGRWSPLLGADLDATAALYWSFDLSPGDH